MSGGRDLVQKVTNIYTLAILASAGMSVPGDSSLLNPAFFPLHFSWWKSQEWMCMCTVPSPFYLASRTWWILPDSLVFLCASLKNWEDPRYETTVVISWYTMLQKHEMDDIVYSLLYYSYCLLTYPPSFLVILQSVCCWHLWWGWSWKKW